VVLEDLKMVVERLLEIMDDKSEGLPLVVIALLCAFAFLVPVLLALS